MRRVNLSSLWARAVSRSLGLVCGLAIAGHGLGAAPAWAGSIDTLASHTGNSIDTFGELSGNRPGGSTYGQTFVIREGYVFAQHLAFRVRGYYPITAPQPCTFQAFIMAWNGSRPTGPVLFQSAALTTFGNGLQWDDFSIPLNYAVLAKDQPYVVFFTANNFLDGIRSDAAMASVGNLYPDGVTVFHSGGFSFNDLLTQDWRTGFQGIFDFAFKLDYQVVPEPQLGALLGLGVLFLWRNRPASLNSSRG